MELTNGYLEGKFLVSSPGMPDNRFEKSVIYVFKHDYSGASGLIINHLSSYLKFADICNTFSVADVETKSLLN